MGDTTVSAGKVRICKGLLYKLMVAVAKELEILSWYKLIDRVYLRTVMAAQSMT